MTTYITIILISILSALLIQAILIYRRKQKLLDIERTKNSNVLIVTPQTAEDFHDDMGNKLARITLLAEILNFKLPDDKPEEKRLIEQIKENANLLYQVTKEILWTVNTKSNNLYELLSHLEVLGTELFHDTDVAFTFNPINQQLEQDKIPIEYSRNTIMIFKELMVNSQKHAQAGRVWITGKKEEKNLFSIEIEDNGIGFDENEFTDGQGIRYVKKRAKRIGALLAIHSETGKGTRIKLLFSLIPGKIEKIQGL